MNDLGSPEFPTAKDDDDDDVGWALSTAHVQWKRGSLADAVVWLRRAIDSAVSVDATWRAAELTRQTDALEAYLLTAAAAAGGDSSSSADAASDAFDGTDSLDVAAFADVPEPSAAADAVVALEPDELVDDDLADDDLAADDLADDDLADDDLADDDLANAVAPLNSLPDDVPETLSEPFPEALTDVVPETLSEPSAPPPEPARVEPEALADPVVSGVLLSEVPGFEDFPPETQSALAQLVRIERLAPDEEVSDFGLALVLRGAVNVMPTITDAICGKAGEREIVYGRGSIADGVALRLVAALPNTEVAVWDFDAIEPALADCPWVLDELQGVADRYQALAGVAMGPMGDRLDDALRGMVMDRCKLVRLLPGEILLERGKPVGGLYMVGAGRIELGDDEAGAGSGGALGPGDFLFAPQVLAAGAAPTVARAGAGGALLMAADRHAAHELMVIVPPLLELLAG